MYTMKTPVAFGETSGKRKLSQSVQNLEHRLYVPNIIIKYTAGPNQELQITKMQKEWLTFLFIFFS